MINSNYLEKKIILLNQPYLIKGIEIFCEDPININFQNLIQSIINIESIKKINFKYTSNYSDISNNNILNNSTNFIENNIYHKKKNHHQNKKTNRNLSKKIFIGGIPPETTKIDLINFFSRYGEIEYCVVNTEILTEKPRGFGFIVFHNKNSLENCLNDSLNHYINGKWVECKRANIKKENNRKITNTNTNTNIFENNNPNNNNFQKDNININNNLFNQFYNNQISLKNNNFNNIRENDDKNFNNINLNCNKNIIKINIENLNNYINIYNVGNNSKIIKKNSDIFFNKKDKINNLNNKKNSEINQIIEREINEHLKNNQKITNIKLKEKEKEKNNQSKTFYLSKQFQENINNIDKKNNKNIFEKKHKKNDLNMTNNIKPKFNYRNINLSKFTSSNFNKNFNDFLKNETVNSKFNDYIYYKLFDINGEEISSLKSYKFRKNNSRNIPLSKSFSIDINEILNKHKLFDYDIIKIVKKKKKVNSFNSFISTDSSQSLISKKK